MNHDQPNTAEHLLANASQEALVNRPQSLRDCLEMLIVLNALEGDKLLNRDKLKACIEFLAWIHPEVRR